MNHHHSSCVNPSMLADAVEAMFAAAYMDSGLETCKTLIRQHLMVVLHNGEAEIRKYPKTLLQELVQGRGHPLPSYTVVNVSSNDRERSTIYEVA
jgi:ribonuclease III